MKTKLLVVIPVFNKEKYISDCISSLAKQKNIADITCLLVDDYSTDNSFSVCKKMSKSYQWIILRRNTKNYGVSYTRNVGIEYAIAHNFKLITFIDADDTIHPLMYSTMCGVLKKYSCDIVMADVDTCLMEIPKGIYYTNKDFPPSYMLEACGSVVKFVYSVSTIKKYHTRFDVNMSLSEDRMFNFELFIKGIKVYNTGEVFYYYRILNNSACHSPNINSYDQQDYYRSRVFRVLENSPIFNDVYVKFYETYFLTYLIDYLDYYLIHFGRGHIFYGGIKKILSNQWLRQVLKKKNELTPREFLVYHKLGLILYFYKTPVYSMFYRLYMATKRLGK